MLEIPESTTLSKQIRETLKGIEISKVIAVQSPHKFAWFYDDPQKYAAILEGQTIIGATSFGSFVQIETENVLITVSEGAGWRYFAPGEKLPAKHQLYLEFTDQSKIIASVKMYGAVMVFSKDTEYQNEYYQVAREKPSPLGEEFTRAYFLDMIQHETLQKKSLKFAIATEQRIPGLGNGSLQDILFHAGLHPKRKVNTCDIDELSRLYDSIKQTLSEMTAKGGRDTETDLFGKPGGYQTFCSKFTVNKPCRVCGTPISKASYMGGSIYYCENCQPL